MRGVGTLKRALSLGMTLAAAGCGDACRALSEKICRCAPSDAERSACLTRVAAAASLREADASPEAERQGREACTQLLGTCSCAALERGQLDACGLDAPRPPGPP